MKISILPQDATATKRSLMLLPSLLTLLIYLPVLHNGFVNWDDDFFIINNYHLKSIGPSSLKWMSTNLFGGFPMPLYWFSLALDYKIGALDPWIYHFDNLVIHCLNTFLVFIVIFEILAPSEQPLKVPAQNQKLTKEAFVAFSVSLLFGIHPLHVESVAWAAERKDLLCGFFFLASLLVYLKYAKHEAPKRPAYLLCLSLFYLALLSKPMAISLPFLLLLLDYYPLKRFQGNLSKPLFEKIPFFFGILSEMSVLLFQNRAGRIISLNLLPLDFRVMNAFHSLCFYLLKMLLPIHLTVFYPIFLEQTYSPGFFAALLLIILISSLCFIYRKTMPYLWAIWLYYVICLLPVLGLIQPNSEAAADRYTYLPCLGPFLLLSLIVWKVFSKSRVFLTIFSAFLFSMLAFGTIHQIGTWKDSVSLWENALKVYPVNNPIVYTNMAYSYQESGRLDDALRWYDQAIATGVPQANPHCGKGEILLQKGDWDKAVQEFKFALLLNPDFAQPHYDLGVAYEKKGLFQEALTEENQAVHLQPEWDPAYHALGVVYGDLGRFNEALQAFQTAHRLNPDNPAYFKDLIAAREKAEKHKRELAL